MQVRLAVDSDRLSLAVASNAEAALIQTNRAPQSVLRDWTQHQQQFLILGVLRRVELVAHVPDVLAKLDRFLRRALKRLLHLHRDQHGHQVAELRMRFDPGRSDVPLLYELSLLAELIDRLRPGQSTPFCEHWRRN